MPSMVDDLADEPPPSIDPYYVLDLPKDATPEQIKTAYRKSALKHHPDKAPSEHKDAAHTRFQEIAFAYAILSDARRRQRYDTTGRTEESLDIEDDDFDWTSFYREQFQDVVTGAKLAEFRAEFKGGAEERSALLAAYTAAEGDLDAVYEEVMLSNPTEDEARFRGIIDQAIQDGEVKAFKNYTKEPAKKRKARMARAKAEEAEAMQMAEELGVKDKLFGDGEAGSSSGKGKGKKMTKEQKQQAHVESELNGVLATLIAARQKSRSENFLANLEAKYAPKPKTKKASKGKKRKIDEPEEDEEDTMPDRPVNCFEAVGRRNGEEDEEDEDLEDEDLEDGDMEDAVEEPVTNETSRKSKRAKT
ncbi:MAG: hypothetical protein M1821_006776 [Bathelium mastoideum]|nr:MAG: hypothetical protein M1821_006776 [Bathelium mastoideum]